VDNRNHRSELLLISIGEARINGIKRTYNDVLPGEFVAYMGSSGFIEIGIRNGNAAEELGAVIGMEVSARMFDH
jgi:S-adenosylmethionine hydrolase